MNVKILNFLLIITSLLGYLEWGIDKHFYLFEIEQQIISDIFKNKSIITHPFVLFPILGQFLLLFTIFQNRPSILLTFIGIICIGLLLGFIAAIGIISCRYKILLSTIPFLIFAFFTFKKISSNLKKKVFLIL